MASNRYGMGYLGRQGPAIVDCWCPFLRSNGGDFYNPNTWEVLVNRPEAVEALEFWGDLMTKYKVVVPDSITWEFDEIIAGGQNDRYAMTVTLTPYGTLINDPQKSKTGGRWAWAPMPGAKTKEHSRTFFGGWSLAVASSGKHKEWAFEFIQMACSKEWMRRSMLRGNAPPRVSVLNDPEMVQKFGWAPVAATALPTGPARCDLGNVGVAVAQRTVAGPARAGDGEAGARWRGERLAAQSATRRPGTMS